MALTRPRASQIYDIDYKQATRVITVSNITLSGGAPSQVDSVNLSLDDRVLVTGQTNKAQNGIYFVDTVGSGSNGTWVRSNDTNTTGELLAGTIVMVTEGTVYHDTQWKLTTDDPIVIGVSELIFEQNSAFAFGNVYANSTAVLATSVGDVLTLSAGNNISIVGNNTSKTVTIGVTGISLNSISNGTSNVNVVSSGGNITVGVAGTSNVVVFNSAGANITGTLGVSGNTTGGNLTTAGRVVATGNIDTAGTININSSSGMYNVLNITGTALGPYGGSQSWKFFTQNAVAGGPGSWILFPDLSTQTTAYPGTTSTLSLSGNIAGDNLIANSAVIATGNITGGNLITAGQITASGNIAGGNILGNGAGLSGINAFSTVAVTGGNSAVANTIASTLTITAGTGISLVMDSATDTLTIAAGASGESIFSTGGQMELVTETVTTSEDLGLVTEVPAAQEYDLGGLFIDGFVGNPNFLPNSIYGNILVADAIINTTGNITGGNIIATSLVTGANVSATANVTGGNLVTTGQVISTGAVFSNYNTNTANVGSFMATGSNTKGGTGYLDFLVVQNTGSGVTNPYKWFRVDTAGKFEIINSAYTSSILNLTDGGNLSIAGQYQVSGKQAVNGPAFRAYIAVNQAITSGSQQKVTFGSETFDTNNNFASSRFTPTVEGYYQLNSTVRMGGVSGTGEIMITIWKNGSEYARGTNESGTEQGAGWYSMQVSDLAYANGSGDYFEIYVQQTSGSNKDTTAGQNISYFSGAMVRGA